MILLQRLIGTLWVKFITGIEIFVIKFLWLTLGTSAHLTIFPLPKNLEGRELGIFRF